ncbi:HAD family hydrolase [Brevibacterium casei]|uniref:HAD family hydrolase n=1 Tax=Brevibacterium casei TaxID=33889 RepID=UPI00223BA379|nr:hypothetical protein [Brevibacterium casei]MCT1549635.1 hypothetical protein [Brevibacterium casei]MCT1559172.1 hypothetical protein [Brevibacterium casei]MCT2207600.1 hypothetical protein [Brevibacterium casei]
MLFNNVIEESNFISLVASRYGINSVDLLAGLDKYDAEYETGQCDVVYVLAEVVSLHAPQARDLVLADVEWLEYAYSISVIPRREAFAGVRSLRLRKPQVNLVLANNEAKRWDDVKNRRFGHFALFDELASSWRIGYVKPSQEYITAVASAFGTTISRLILIDDNPAVLSAAADQGLAGVAVIGQWPTRDIDRAVALAQKA